MKKKFSTYLAGNIIFGLSQWLTVIILTKTVNISQVGYYSLALAYSGPLLMLLGWGLKTLYITKKSSRNELFLLNRLIMLLIYTFIISFLLLSKGVNPTEFYLLLIISLTKGMESLQEMLFAFRQKKMEHHIIGKIKIVQSVVTILIISLLFIDASYPSLMFLGVLLFTAVLLIIEMKNFRLFSLKSYKGIKIYSVLSLSVTGIPLGITLAVSSLNTNIPRIFLEYNNGIQELGYFASLMFFYSAGNTLMFSISGFLLPVIVNNLINTNYIKMIYKNISILFWITSSIGWIFIFFYGDIILRFVYNSKFQSYHNEFLIIMLGAIFTYFVILMDVLYSAKEKFNYLLIIQIITVIIISAASSSLISVYGTLGASIAFLIGISFHFLIKLIGFVRLLESH